MTVVAVLGAGAGGAAATAELTRRGYGVRLWNRSIATLEPLLAIGGVGYEGVLGHGLAEPELITGALSDAVDGVDAVLVCLPALGHEGVAHGLAELGLTVPVVLNPGHTGGSLHFRQVFDSAGAGLPPLAELSTLAYVARKRTPETVNVTGAAEQLRAACLPGGEAALELAVELYPVARPERDVLATGLANVNLVLHPPGALLGAAWIEATGGDYLFYAEGVTPGVARTIAALDRERLAVAAGFGHELPPLHEEMAVIGTADRAAAARGDLAAAIALGAANSAIRAPDSLAHRYYAEDFGFGLVPLLELGRIAGVETPVASALLRLGEVVLGRDLCAEGLDAARLGIAGLDRDGLLELVRGGVRA